MTVDPDLTNLLLDYVAGGLNTDERAEVDRRIGSGESAVLVALAEAEATFAAVPESLDPVAPTMAARASLLHRVIRDAPDTVPAAAAPVVTRASSNRLALAAGLLIGATVGAGIVGFILTQQRRHDLNRITAIEEQVRKSDARFVQQQRRIEDFEAFVRLTFVEGSRVAKMTGADGHPAASGELVWDPATGEFAFYATQMTLATRDEAYELWFVTDGDDAVSLGTFKPDPSGAATVVGQIDDLPTDLKLAAVSLERAGGSTGIGPTGPIVMSGIH